MDDNRNRGLIKKVKTRYGRYADLDRASIALWHLIEDWFPGISFEYKIINQGQGKDLIIIDNRGKLRLDQNDGTPVPLDQILDILYGKNAEVIVKNNDVQIGQRRILNFHPGSNVSLTILDDPANDEIDVTIDVTGGGPSAGEVYNEVPSGAINGVNKVFTTVQNFVPASTRVYLNGLREKLGYGYNETGANQITFNEAPVPGDLLWIDYRVLT